MCWCCTGAVQHGSKVASEDLISTMPFELSDLRKSKSEGIMVEPPSQSRRHLDILKNNRYHHSHIISIYICNIYIYNYIYIWLYMCLTYHVSRMAMFWLCSRDSPITNSQDVLASWEIPNCRVIHQTNPNNNMTKTEACSISIDLWFLHLHF